MYELGDITLDQNKPVTFTYDMHKAFDFNFPSTVQSRIQVDMAPYGTVTKVDRGLFSGRYTITIIPNQAMDPTTWRYLLQQSLSKAGYPNNTFVSMEGGTTSTQSGGVKQVTQVVSNKVAQDIIAPIAQGAIDMGTSALKPLIPIAIVGVAGYLGYLWLQAKAMGRR